MNFLTTWHGYYKIWLDKFELEPDTSRVVYNLSIIVLTILFAFFAYKLAKWLIYKLANVFSRRKKIDVLEALKKHKFFSYLSYYFPLFILRYNISIALPRTEKIHAIMQSIHVFLAVVLFSLIVNSILNTVVQLKQYKTENRSKPIKGLVQFAQIILFFITAIICISIVFSKSPGTIVAGLGAASAVLMLIFKDSITGLVAGVQISFNGMVEIGDWISLTKYDVDGEVVDITLTSIKVKNWDNTVSTVPSYNLVVNDSVKNWQNMIKSGGRQMKRSINIDMLSVRFCTEEMLHRYSKIEGVKIPMDTIALKNTEQTERTEEKPDPFTANTPNNLGILRKYLFYYLSNHPRVNKSMNIIVRQNQPTQFGIPLEVYCFSNTTVWAEYENIQSDIMEHILAMLPFFDLKVYQSTMASR